MNNSFLCHFHFTDLKSTMDELNYNEYSMCALSIKLILRSLKAQQGLGKKRVLETSHNLVNVTFESTISKILKKNM